MSGGDLIDETGASPCLLHELDANGSPGVDPRQALDVARWRRAERERLIAARLALSPRYRSAQTEAMTQRLNQLLPQTSATIVSVYWPIQGEPDLRHWMTKTFERGIRVALPVALTLGHPLAFREWRPGMKLARGRWNIPYPADDAEVTPSVVLAPVVGFDSDCYRLGYGGGFFDRTLAQMDGKPLVIGVGYDEVLIRTIFPQPHDIPMTWIVTGSRSLQARQ